MVGRGVDQSQKTAERVVDQAKKNDCNISSLSLRGTGIAIGLSSDRSS
jgi:hypothetical protein